MFVSSLDLAAILIISTLLIVFGMIAAFVIHTVLSSPQEIEYEMV